MENFKAKTVNEDEWIKSITIAKGTIKRKRHDLFMEIENEKWKGVKKETLSRQVPDYEDSEGNKVFTNDKMSLQYFGEIKEGVVVFDDRKLRYALDISDDRDMSVLIPLCEVDGVVVGNIHDEK